MSLGYFWLSLGGMEEKDRWGFGRSRRNEVEAVGEQAGSQWEGGESRGFGGDGKKEFCILIIVLLKSESN